MAMAETFSDKTMGACLTEYFKLNSEGTLQFGASGKMTLLCSPVSFIAEQLAFRIPIEAPIILQAGSSASGNLLLISHNL